MSTQSIGIRRSCHRLLSVGAWLALCVTISGCNVCGRQVVFDLTIHHLGSPVEGAVISVECTEHDGTVRQGNSVSDAQGQAYFRVSAPNRDCPDNPTQIAAYFTSCTLHVNASGYAPLQQTLTGAEMDGLHPAETYQDGNHVPLNIELTPQR